MKRKHRPLYDKIEAIIISTAPHRLYQSRKLKSATAENRKTKANRAARRAKNIVSSAKEGLTSKAAHLHRSGENRRKWKWSNGPTASAESGIKRKWLHENQSTMKREPQSRRKRQREMKIELKKEKSAKKLKKSIGIGKSKHINRNENIRKKMSAMIRLAKRSAFPENNASAEWPTPLLGPSREISSPRKIIRRRKCASAKKKIGIEESINQHRPTREIISRNENEMSKISINRNNRKKAEMARRKCRKMKKIILHHREKQREGVMAAETHHRNTSAEMKSMAWKRNEIISET